MLFDVDGTLLLTHDEVYVEASRLALEAARERAGNWPRERTVAVGDTPLDVSSAHTAGCLCIGVTTGSYDHNDLAAADAVIADLGELAAALAALS